MLSSVYAPYLLSSRVQVKDLLAYLQLIDNPHFVPAFNRVINVPARGIGDKVCIYCSYPLLCLGGPR